MDAGEVGQTPSAPPKHTHTHTNTQFMCLADASHTKKRTMARLTSPWAARPPCLHPTPCRHLQCLHSWHPRASPVGTLPGSATCCLMWVSAPTSDLHTEAATDPNGRRRGLLSGWGPSADTPSSPSPAHTAEHRGSLACLRAFAHAIPCLAHSPNSCSLSGVQQPPASAAHHTPRSSCSLARRLQPWGGS